MNVSNKHIKTTLFIFLILFIFYLLNKWIKSSSEPIKEHYLTYFLPGYNNEKNALYQFYDKKEYNYLDMKSNFIYQPLNFGFVETLQGITSNYLSSVLLANSKIQKIQRRPYDNFEKLIEDVSQNKIQFALLPFPIISYYTFYNHSTTSQFTKLNYILAFFRRYLFILTKRKFGIVDIKRIKLGTRIGVMSDGVVNGNVVANDVLNFLKYKEGTDYFITEYKSPDDLLSGFYNDEVDIIFYQGYATDLNLNKYITENQQEEIYILPFKLPNEDVFFNSNFQYYSSYYDLNKISPVYLPKTFGGHTYSRNNPSIKLLCFDEYLITNPRVNNDIIYEVIKTFYESINLLNSFPELRDNPISSVGVERDTNMPILYHNGAYKFYKERGFITDNPNPNCRYLVGRMECTEETLADNNLLLEGPQF